MWGGKGVLKNKWLWLSMIALMVVFTACSKAENTMGDEEASKAVADPVYNPPSIDDLDPDDPMTPHVQYGEEVFKETNTVLNERVGNELSCMSCHADGGLSKNTSMVGVTTQYPEYQSREGAVLTLEERINSCMRRSMNGEKLDYDGKEMRAIVAYLTYSSKGIKAGADIPWRTEKETIEEIPEPNVENGEELYEQKNCLSCHATDGSGTGANSGPALWGDNSFNDGASVNRMQIMTDYIKLNMPPDDAGSLKDQEAADLAAFLLSQERPKWEDHDADWPNGDRPTDIITKDRREKIQEGTFDWTEIENIIPAN